MSGTTATETPAAKTKSEEKGTSILQAFYKALERELGTELVKTPNTAGSYTKISQPDGKTFGYVFPPRPHSVAVKIPKQLLGIEGDLPKDHGFKRTEWGLTRTVSAAAELPKLVKAFAVAAAAVRPAVAEEAGTKS